MRIFLFLWFLGLAGLAQAGSVPIDDLISQNQLAIQASDSTERAALEALDLTLNFIKANPQSYRSCQKDLLIHPRAAKKFVSISRNIARFPVLTDKRVNPVSLLQMVSVIEDEKSKFSKPKLFIFNLEFVDGETRPVKIFIRSPDDANLDFGEAIHKGSGGDKVVEETYDYETWARLAFLTPLNGRPTRDFLFEGELFKLLYSLPPSERTGIVETLFVSPEGILQRLYDSSLSRRLERDRSRGEFHTLDYLEILRQVSEGVVNLHKQGILHRDLKTGNFLVLLNSTQKVAQGAPRYRAVVNDLGLAKLLRKKPAVHGVAGTYETMSPEIRETWLEGATPEEQVARLLKRDVFALATVAAKIFNPELAPWCKECSEEIKADQKEKKSFAQLAASLKASKTPVDYTLAPKEYARFFPCRDRSLARVFARANAGEFADPLSQLILRGLNPDPAQRISSTEWLEQLDRHISIEKNSIGSPEHQKQLHRKGFFSRLISKILSESTTH